MKKNVLLMILIALGYISMAQIKQTVTKSTQPKYGALAMDRANGIHFGWAYDHDSQHEADSRALEECKKKGGNCSVVLSFSGEGCASYCTVKLSQGTAYGWGVARTKTEADAIAANECKKRSKGIPASNYVWACNSKTSAKLTEIYNAKNETIATKQDANITNSKTQPDAPKNTAADASSKTTSNASSNTSAWSEWVSVKNPYSSIQVRYKLEKQEGEYAFYKTQLRINYDDKSRCVDPRCIGYVMSFGYMPVNKTEFSFLHFKFYYPYKDVYTMPELIPLKVLYPDGSKRLLKPDGGCYFSAKGSAQETYISCFNNSADQILTGSPVKCNNFVESQAVVLR